LSLLDHLEPEHLKGQASATARLLALISVAESWLREGPGGCRVDTACTAEETLEGRLAPARPLWGGSIA